MPNQIYSPFSLSQVAERSYNPYSAMQVGERDRQAMEAQRYALESMMIGNQQSQANLDRYRGMTPGEISKSQYEGSLADARRTNPAYIPSVMAGDMGMHQQNQAKGMVDMGTAQSTVDTTNASNSLKAFADKLQMFRATRSGVTFMDDATYRRIVREAPAGLKNFLPAQYDEKAIDDIINVLADTPAQRGAEQTKRLDRESAERIGKGNNAASVRVAEINAESRLATAMARLQFMMNNKQNFQQFLTDYARKRAAGANTPEDDLVAQMIEMMMYQSRTAPPGAIDPNAPAGQIFNIPPRGTPPSAIPPAPQPQPQSQPQAGGHTLQQLMQMYPGKSADELKAAYKRKFGVEPK